MKRMIRIPAWLFLPLLVILPSLSFGYQNEPVEGFRDIPWATNIRDLGKSMKLDSEDGEEKFYTRRNDKLEIAGASIDKITYGFYQGLFYSVIIRFSSEENYMRLKQRLAEIHGGTAAYRSRPEVEDYYWGLMESVFLFRKRSDVVINLVFDPQTQKGHIAYAFTPLSDIIKDGATPKPENSPVEETKTENKKTENTGGAQVETPKTEITESGDETNNKEDKAPNTR